MTVSHKMGTWQALMKVLWEDVAFSNFYLLAIAAVKSVK